MQMARKIVTEISLSCRKNLKITCRGDHVTYYFLSGSGGNQLAVETDRGKIVVRTIRRTWREAIKDVFKNNWKAFVGVFVYIAGTAMQLAANVPFLPLAGKAVQGIGKMIMQDAVNDQLYKLTD